MITWLDVQNFILVKHVSLNFQTGMTVLTGETGAGKSIIVDALAILLGDRASGEIVRSGADHAEIQAGFKLSQNPQAVAWLASRVLDDDTGECSLRRLVFKKQPSRGFINGHPVPIHYLQDLGSLLVDIHSQHEHHRLLRGDNQRAILDSYANNTELVDALAISFDRLTNSYQELEELEEKQQDFSKKQALLEEQIRELTMLDPDPEEIELLEEKHKRLSHTVELAADTWNVIQYLDEYEDASASTLINKSIQRLIQLSKHDSRLSQLSDDMEDIFTRLREIISDLRRWQSEYDVNPSEIADVEKRISLLHTTGRKYQVQPSELQALLFDLKDEFASTDKGIKHIEGLRKKINRLENYYDDLAEQICGARVIASKNLAAKVTTNLFELGFPDAVFEIKLAHINKIRGRYGTESIMFLIKSVPDSQAGPLAKIASGGELSRVSLAIQVSVTTSDAAPSSIYDEVDVGIGGRIAEIVGNKLKALAIDKQVLCITHLPQVAVQGNRHIQITKRSGKETEIGVTNLDAEQRLEEISRMLGGIEITRETRAHAAAMLKRAGN